MRNYLQGDLVGPRQQVFRLYRGVELSREREQTSTTQKICYGIFNMF